MDAATLERVRGLGDPTSMLDVREVYLPLTRLLSRYFLHTSELHRSTNDFLQLEVGRTPFVIGIAGSVAVGKSTTARLLRELLAGWPEHPRVSLVTTDGFLLPNAELERRGLMQRKGFPESYDRRALLRFVMEVKSGTDEVAAPVYDHLGYDIVPGRRGDRAAPRHPDPRGAERAAARPGPLRRHHRPGGQRLLRLLGLRRRRAPTTSATGTSSRFLSLRETAFRDPRSYFTRYAELTPEQAVRQARHLWDTINGPNLDPEHPADPRPGHRHPAQGRRPPGQVGADPQGVASPPQAIRHVA